MTDATVNRLNAAFEGRYAIERELGEGGMATVYLAEDRKHHRKVALKVLKPNLAAVVGAERFLAEIETTANLQHPNILPLFDSGEADGFLFYVMPYVEGDTLKDRLHRERQLPVSEAVDIATDVAEALQTAHDQGVIHRDIKPGNILISRGKPLVADFGIALAVSAAGGGERLTETGLSLGTPYYMSPEQATGDQVVGPSTDTYALGCVLYEMLVGEPPYPGGTAQAVLGKIIAGEPVSAAKQRPSVPANVDAAVRRALEKLPADRFRSALEFAKALEDEHFRYGQLAAAGAGDAVGPWNRLTLAFAALFALAAVTATWSILRPDPPRPVTRISVRIPEDQLFDPERGDLDLSSDGSLMVYRGVGDGGQPQLWARRWDGALEATPVRDTDNAVRPAISPDGQEVAFYILGSDSIRVVPLQEGVSRTLPVSAHSDGAYPRWGPDGAWIYYRDASGGLSRLPPGGGVPQIVTVVDTAAGDEDHVNVDVLPGSRAVYEVTGLGKIRRIQAVDVETGALTDLTTGRHPRYSTTGHLLFQDATAATLYAAPFDVERLELTGAPVPLAEGLTPIGFTGSGSFAVSQTGRLVYHIGSSRVLSSQEVLTPVWVQRDGTAREIEPGWEVRGNSTRSSLALSPGDTRLAISISEQGTFDMWVKQLDAGPLLRLTSDRTYDFRASWSPGAQSLTFVSDRAGQGDVWTKRADGSGTAERVLDRQLFIPEAFYTPDNEWLVFREGETNSGAGDIYAIRLLDGVEVPLVVTESIAYSPAISPDGRWLAYVSNRSGRDEVYVRPFPDAGSAVVPVSADGGRDPIWAHNGRELFYRNYRANELVVVQFRADPTFEVGQQDVLFSMEDYLPSNGHPMYDVSLDDRRFVMLRLSEAAASPELVLVDNWAEELRERVGN